MFLATAPAPTEKVMDTGGIVYSEGLGVNLSTKPAPK